MSPDIQNDAQTGPKINVGRVDSITIYEVTESELSTLESGTPTGYLFDLFLCLLTLGISFLVTVTTTEIKSNRLFAVYTILAIGSIIGAAICFCLWLKFRKSTDVLIATIKKRVQPPPASQTADPNAKG